MRGCEIVWEAADAARVQQLVERAAQGPCPCLTGLDCPLITPQLLEQLRKTIRTEHPLPV